jgi:hemoglobin
MSTSVPASPHPELSGGAASITEPMIRDLVHAFYARARRDEILGPIFEAKVTDWPAHLENMCAFWSSATLRSGRYKGHPMLPHARISEIEKAHFMRWLALFGETAAETCPSEAAALSSIGPIGSLNPFKSELPCTGLERQPFVPTSLNAQKEEI